MRLGLFGRGRLGSAVLERAANLPGLEVAWALELGEEPGGPVDVALDVSAADAAEAHFAWALERGTDLVIGTTGWTLEPRELERRLDGRIGLLVASNFSLTVAFMARVAEAMGRFAALDPARDPYVFEHHHRLKADAPSGASWGCSDSRMRGMVESLIARGRSNLVESAGARDTPVPHGTTSQGETHDASHDCSFGPSHCSTRGGRRP